MKNLIRLLAFTLVALSWSCSTPPTSNPTPATTTTAAPATTPTAEAPTATPTPQVTINLTSEEGISGMQKLIDDQVSNNVLVAKEMEVENKKVKAWSGEAGVRRLNVVITHSPEHKEEVTYWCYEGKVISFGGSGKDGETSYFYWAGVSPDGTLQGPPFKKMGGESADFSESEVRERHQAGQELLDAASS